MISAGGYQICPEKAYTDQWWGLLDPLSPMNTSTELCGPSKTMTLCLPAAASGVLLPLLVFYFCVAFINNCR